MCPSKSSRDSSTLVSTQSSTTCSLGSRQAFSTGGRPYTTSPCCHKTSRIAFRLKRRPELCLSTSQQPTTLYGTAASPATCCNCYLIDTWFTWSWRWLTIADSPSPPETAKEAGYDASKTASHRHLSWPSSLQHLHLWPANHRLQKVCICWQSSNHPCWWRLASSGRGSDQGHGNCKWIPPDLEVKAQHYKDGVGSFPPQQQGS